MWKTILILIFTLIVVPVVAFNFDNPLTVLQKTIFSKLIWIYLAMALLCFIISTLVQNYSQVDKLWSIMPIVYAWMVYCEEGHEKRLLIMAILVTIWGISLSYNFVRRGGYAWKFWIGEEDYRWTVLRAKPEIQPHWRWILFNFFFISLYQMGLILLFTLPILKSMAGKTLSVFDVLLALIFIGFVIIEAIADQQQWNYQKEKSILKDKKELHSEKYRKGFVHHGLWSKVRHPNYAAEQSIWIVFYFFSVIASGNWINWSMVGCLLLILLFKGSSDFSEKISLEKYPEYEEYQKKVPRFVPFFLNRE